MVIEMNRSKVTSLFYAPTAKILLSGGEDCLIVSWVMTAKRKEVRSL